MRSERARTVIVASWIGILGNGLLAAAKISIGFIAGSLAVLADGIDSGLDIVTSIITLFTGRIIDKPPDIRHPYGHTRAETIATKLVSFVIFFAGAQLALSTIHTMREGTVSEFPSPLALYVTVVSIVGKIGLAVHKYVVGRRIDSAMLIADGKNMRADVVVSLTVLVGLGFIYILEMPILDSIIALLVSVWIMKVAFTIFMETTVELMEGHADEELYRRIFDCVEKVEGASHPHRARIRKMGAMLIVDLDIEVDGALSVSQAHEIVKSTERTILSIDSSIYDVLVHVEPEGNVEDSERFGVSQRELDAKS